MQMLEDGIPVAKGWTELPSKVELEWHLYQAFIEAGKRTARRGVLLRGERDE